ncbi:MAG: preprotein translocase subunit SecG [Gammaproteobacteria bacterium]|jgi:preprotein translocase subunit SecG|nr:preprotein translocase subunit SecG [Gammaproteobacteria bacterium]|tara:strand:- start:71 stop:451 length:381 start_codon:yes stop_codon:yes gene_type:complete
METIIVVVHLVVAVIIVGLVLLQQGKGADAGASFGAGASQTVFGASGSGNFLVRATTVAAVIFFITSLSLSLVAKNQTGFSSTTGLPVVSPEVLESVSEVEADVPQLEASPTTENTQEDLPNLPSN